MILSDCSNADIALVVDTSDSVRTVWNAQNGLQTFLRLFIEQFDIGFDRTRISSQTFGNSGIVNWILRRHLDLTSMLNAVPTQRFVGGRTLYDEALRVVRTQQFTETSGDRPNSPNIVVLVTDGTESMEARFAVLQEAQRLRDAGATIYVIGYGPNANREYLQQIAGDPRRIYIESSVPRLIETLPNVIATICPRGQVVPTSPPFTPRPAESGMQ